ncbi:MAG TPA: hypothetical protein VLB74_10930 [Flavobacterium sp.]|uniref:hypothetical protein n=1 Tax=Flavobacterium sp. TaxID=239 RepID=UPI002BCB9492|nr:hypothetical protein [Flavobacterium sp.]HSD15153.1 hypothetical protein [Flavobacterium sp.]
MKKIFRKLSVPLSVFYLFVSVMACAPTDTDQQDKALSEAAKLNAKKGVMLFREFQGNENRMFQRLEEGGVTQEMIDEYLVGSGFKAGEVSVETVTEIIQRIGENQNVSFEDQVNSLEVSSFVKTKLGEIKEAGYIEDLSNQKGFKILPESEKVLLLNSNELVNEFNKAAQDGTVNVPCPNEGCTALMVLAGAGIGTALCGPVCGVVGGVVGLIIGTSMKP